MVVISILFRRKDEWEMSVALEQLFSATGGPDPSAPVVPNVEPTAEFLSNFTQAQFTGANGAGPILNANAILLPNRMDNYRDTSNSNDFRLGNGLGVSRAFRKPDSMAGHGPDGFYGRVYPNVNFGRVQRSHDLNWRRDDMYDRARMGFKKMGYKPNEKPYGAYFQPWQWNDLQALGIGSHGNQYNRNTPLPDADAVARRLYEPTPSRKTKMLHTDVEEQALRENLTRLHPVTVVSRDMQRMKHQRIPRNTDVRESVIYENIIPRGMGPPNDVAAPKVWADTSVLRIPIGTNETGDRTVLGRWGNQDAKAVGDPMAASSNEDRLLLRRSDLRSVRGKDLDREVREFVTSNRYLNSRPVADPNYIAPQPGEYPHGTMQDINTPLRDYSDVAGKAI